MTKVDRVLLHDIRELLVINTIILGLLAILVAYLVGYYTP